MRRPTRESEKREKKRKMNLSVVFAKMAMLVLIMLLGYLCARIGGDLRREGKHAVRTFAAQLFRKTYCFASDFNTTRCSALH